MQVQAKKVEFVDVEVRDDVIFESMLTLIRQRCGLGYREWVNEDGDLLETIEAYHGSDWDEKRGKATELQRLGYETIKNMTNIYYKRVPVPK